MRVDRHIVPLVCWCMALMLAQAVCAQTGAGGSPDTPPSISLAGQLGSKALLVIDGGSPRALAVGESYRGFKVLQVGKDSVTLEQAGQSFVVRSSDSPLGSHVKASSASNRIVINASSGGHYQTAGQINGQHVEFLVDTGATAVAMGTDTAQAIGLHYKAGQPVKAQTANGVVTGYLLMLDSVRVGAVTVHQVEAFVSPSPMRRVLLGNSFLSRFDMQQSSGQLVLERRY